MIIAPHGPEMRVASSNGYPFIMVPDSLAE